MISLSLEGSSQELSVMGAMWIDSKWPYFREDLFQCSHSERLFHEGAVQVSEIEEGDEEVTNVET